MTDGTGTTIDGWDSLGRLMSEQNGAGARFGYGYDLMGPRYEPHVPRALT